MTSSEKNTSTTSHRWQLSTAFLAGMIIGVVIGVGLAPRAMPATAPATADTAARDAYLAEMAGDAPSLGDADAPVTIVEFSDFQCPFCRRHALVTFPEIKKNFIDTGKVRYVYRHFSSPDESYHPGGYVAAEATECARDQDLFWEVWQLVYERQEELAPGRTLGFDWATLQSWLAEIDALDQTRLAACVESGEKRELVDADTMAGIRYGVTGTPAVFVQGSLISGAQPYPVFAAAIERAIAGIE